MKPADHPEFFTRPPPEGRSRESSIVLDENGEFWHDGERVEHGGMAQAFASWVGRHPIDGRYILNNGYDWTYFRVADAPFFVVGLAKTEGGVDLELSDGSREPLEPARLALGRNDCVYVTVKAGAFTAKFGRAAQLALLPFLEEDANGAIFVVVGAQRAPLRPKPC